MNEKLNKCVCINTYIYIYDFFCKFTGKTTE